MKRKAIFSFAAGLFLLGGLSSCMDLDETVYDKLPSSSFGQTEVELNALIGNSHNTLKRYWTGYLHISECSGSMAVTPTRRGGDWYDGGQFRELFMHTWTAQTGKVKDAWNVATESIATCSEALLRVQNSTVLAEDVKQKDIADLRGLRAFWNYVMLDYWGNIPLMKEFKPTDKEFLSNTSRQEAFDWIISELEEIKDQCPEPTHENYGSFTQGAAYTLLAKMYLNAEAWGVTVSGNAYQKAVECCDKVLAMGYVLEPKWKDNFCVLNDKSREAILAATFSSNDTGADGNVKNEIHNNTLHYKDYLGLGITASGTSNGICAQPEYVRLFDEADPRFKGSFLIGLMIDKSTGKPIITDHNNELNHTIDVTMIPGMEYDGTNWSAVEQHDGARCMKWEYAADLTSAMENDFHVFRLADIYLMKAEALLRGGGSVSEATSLVNQIRERAFGNADHNYATVTLQDVQLERRLEFAWELFSRQDDIRFGCYEKAMWPASHCDRKADAYLKLMPVSQDAWQVNPHLKQNPGYPAFSK